MNLFMNILNLFYTTILNGLGMPEMAAITNEWIASTYMGLSGIFRLGFLLLILNIIHHPGKYKFKIPFVPMLIQVALRQIVFLTILLNPVVSILLIAFLSVKYAFKFWGFFSLGPGDNNPFESFLG